MKFNLELKDLDYYRNISWSTSTDEEIRNVLLLANMGIIDLEKTCGWKIGDERQIKLTTREPVTFVLMHKGGYVDIYNNEVNFIVGMKNCLGNPMQMNDDVHKDIFSWGKSDLRAWLNKKFYKYYIPDSIKPIFKKFKCFTGVNRITVQTTNDYFTLPAEKEVFGYRTYYNQSENDALFQFDYYKTPDNRIKKNGGNALSKPSRGSGWWERSPSDWEEYNFCSVSHRGTIHSEYDINWEGVSPMGCI